MCQTVIIYVTSSKDLPPFTIQIRVQPVPLKSTPAKIAAVRDQKAKSYNITSKNKGELETILGMINCLNLPLHWLMSTHPCVTYWNNQVNSDGMHSKVQHSKKIKKLKSCSLGNQIQYKELRPQVASKHGLGAVLLHRSKNNPVWKQAIPPICLWSTHHCGK